MAEKLVVGPVNKGLKTNVLPFNIDNDSFPTLINAYQWRGRVKRKRGTSTLGRLQRFFTDTSLTYNPTDASLTLNGSGVGNVFTAFGLQPNASIIPGTFSVTFGATTFKDPTEDGYLTPTGTGGDNLINYATGTITIPTLPNRSDLALSFWYYPALPVMGIEDWINPSSIQFPGTIEFDKEYSYNQQVVEPYGNYDVSFYKNPPDNATTMPGYVAKTTLTPTTWNGQNYQQFWTTNYEGAMWATNGITDPFTTANIGMQFKPIVTVTVTSGGPPAIVSLQITGHGLSVGDFLFINEVVSTTGINWQTGYVTTVTNANNVVVEFPNATISTNGTGGIAQYLTNRSNTSLDCIRFYDGDPTGGQIPPAVPTLAGINGWVNYMPPLNNITAYPFFSVLGLQPAQYYLVGARMIIPFKDRLLFFGPVVQTSSGVPIYLQDSVVFSQNGTPYYTASFTNTPTATVDNPTSPTNVYHPLLVPVNQVASPSAMFEDQAGFGGYITAGIDQAINSVAPNSDVLIIGFTQAQARMIYTGNDLLPFNFYIINSELGTSSTFSTIIMDKGIISRGSRGYVFTSQTEATRIDLDIPDQVFEVNLLNNGIERFCAQRDYENEWIYFTYCSDEQMGTGIYPNQTLFYNYRDNSWAIFNESYTTYGSFKKETGYTWATVGNTYPTWKSWTVPWDEGSSEALEPRVLAGNQQGFIIERESDDTGEQGTLYIQNISGVTVTSPDHNLNQGDYIIINGALGTIGPSVNGLIFQVGNVTETSFSLLPPPASTGTYAGGGLITRMYIPLIQTKQFPMGWGLGRKTRLGVQQYLLSTTDNAQITLLIYLSQNASSAYNNGLLYPNINADNSGLIYSTVLYTCPESTNLGLTPSNINLNMVTASQQSQIWHRINTSLLGDTVQLGFTLSPTQMTSVDINGNPISQFAEIEIHGFVIDVSASQLLA